MLEDDIHFISLIAHSFRPPLAHSDAVPVASPIHSEAGDLSAALLSREIEIRAVQDRAFGIPKHKRMSLPRRV